MFFTTARNNSKKIKKLNYIWAEGKKARAEDDKLNISFACPYRDMYPDNWLRK